MRLIFILLLSIFPIGGPTANASEGRSYTPGSGLTNLSSAKKRELDSYVAKVRRQIKHGVLRRPFPSSGLIQLRFAIDRTGKAKIIKVEGGSEPLRKFVHMHLSVTKFPKPPESDRRFVVNVPINFRKARPDALR